MFCPELLFAFAMWRLLELWNNFILVGMLSSLHVFVTGRWLNSLVKKALVFDLSLHVNVEMNFLLIVFIFLWTFNQFWSKIIGFVQICIELFNRHNWWLFIPGYRFELMVIILWKFIYYICSISYFDNFNVWIFLILWRLLVLTTFNKVLIHFQS